MTRSAIPTLARAAVRYAREDLAGRIEFPSDRLGTVLVAEDGSRFEVYRETALRTDGEADGDAVVLEFRLRLTEPEAGAGLRALLTRPVANVATPFFAGLPGFRRKLWLAAEDEGAFLELYEWRTERDAERFVRLMEGLLGAVGLADAAAFDVTDADSVEAYVAGHARGWHRRDRLLPQRARRPSAALAALGLGALALAAAVAVRRRSG